MRVIELVVCLLKKKKCKTSCQCSVLRTRRYFLLSLLKQRANEGWRCVWRCVCGGIVDNAVMIIACLSHVANKCDSVFKLFFLSRKPVHDFVMWPIALEHTQSHAVLGDVISEFEESWQRTHVFGNRCDNICGTTLRCSTGRVGLDIIDRQINTTTYTMCRKMPCSVQKIKIKIK